MPHHPWHDHTPEAIAARLTSGPRLSYLRDWVYGGIDGAVTTFAVVVGVIGAELSTRTILILGAANLVADGFSMAAGNYLGTRAETDEYKMLEKLERRAIQALPEGETEEVRQIFIQKGFGGEALDTAVRTIVADRDRWVRLMMQEEYGQPFFLRSPWRAALSTYSAFVACGLVPLAPYVLRVKGDPASGPSLTWACALTGATFFGIGSLKSRWSITPWWRSGLSTLLVGGLAAGLAYWVGRLLATL